MNKVLLPGFTREIMEMCLESMSMYYTKLCYARKYAHGRLNEKTSQ